MTYEKNIPEESQVGMGYQHTLMYGRYTKDLGDYAKNEAHNIRKDLEKKRKKEDQERKKELNKYRGKYTSKLIAVFGWFWRHTFAKLGEDWVFLALLGFIMACIGYVVDIGVGLCYRAQIWLFRHLFKHAGLQFMVWVSLPVLLVLFASTFVHIAPQSIGSGIPEMKTILRGINLKEYLTFRTLVAKVVGLTATLGSGMPLGKEGPLVHIASIVANLLSQLVTSFQGIYANESRKSEMLAAACAVGVATCFGAPIGGVLFSIEVTAVYFAVRNYWRGFFAAVFGATCYRLCAVWFSDEDTVTAVFRTYFEKDFPYDVQELFVFALLGVVCGVGGALFVWAHRQYVFFIRNTPVVKQFLSSNKFLYPVLVSFVITALTFPKGLGKYVAGDLNTFGQVTAFFSNFTWTKSNFTVREAQMLEHWVTPDTGVFVSLSGFIIFNFIFAIVASTLPVPSGSFIPVFKIGAGIGRVAGEMMHLWFPSGVSFDQLAIIPGGYAMVGAAAFSGAVTRTVSVAVIITEMTGQITHIVPIMIGVLIANGTARYLQPSLYDSIIVIKKLPYLPDLLSSSSGMYNIYVDSFMVREVKCIWKNMTYKELNEVLKANKTLRSIPLVDNLDSMILLGSVQRRELLRLLEGHIGRKRRQQMAAQWQLEARERAREELDRQLEAVQKRRQSRFEVIPAPDILKLQPISNEYLLTPQLTPQHSPKGNRSPKKSILKKSNSFLSKSFSNLVPSNVGPYSTVTGAESSRPTLHQTDPEFSPKQDKREKYGSRFLDMLSISPNSSVRSLKKVILPRERVIDMSSEDQKQWEEEEMAKKVDFDKCHIDPAPFQLVEKTSLLKVHSLFSMVGVNHAYVTAIGRLIGVVALKELRKAIEDSNAGVLPVDSTPGTASEGTLPDDPLLVAEPLQVTVHSLDSILDEKSLDISESGAERKKRVA